MKAKPDYAIWMLILLFLISSCTSVEERVKEKIAENRIDEADNYCNEMKDKEQVECFTCLAKELFDRKWYLSASYYYAKGNNREQQQLCSDKISAGLKMVSDGKTFARNLPVPNGCCITNDLLIISNSDSNQLKTSYLLSDSNFILPSVATVYNKFLYSYPSGLVLAALGDSIQVIEPNTRKTIKNLKGHSAPVTDLSFVTNKPSLLSSSWDKTIKLWDINTFGLIKTFSGHGSCVTSMATCNDGNVFASGSWDNSIKIWNVEAGTCQKTIDTKNPVMDIAFSSDGKFIYSISKGNTIDVWNVRDGKSATTLNGHENIVKTIECSDDGNFLISGDFNGVIKIWDIRTSKLIKSFQAHECAITSISIASNSLFFITGGMDNKIHFWWLADKGQAIDQLSKQLTVK